MNKKVIIVIILILIIGLSAYLFLRYKDYQTEDKKDQTIKTPITTEKPLANLEGLSQENKEFLEKLLNNKDYKNINTNDKLLNHKFNALEVFIYAIDTESLEDPDTSALFSAITYYIKDSDIKIDKQSGSMTYGYIEKSKLDKELASLFNDIRFKITTETNEEIISIAGGSLKNVSSKYRNAQLLKVNSKDYYFLFTGYEDEDPYPSKAPIKIMDVREYDDYILVISKAVYRSQIDMEDNKLKMNVCEDVECNKVIEELTINQGQKFDINIDKYLDKAKSTIYTVFKKDEQNYHLYKSLTTQS